MNDEPTIRRGEPVRQDRLIRLFEWVAARDPLNAARLLALYLADLAEEEGGRSTGSAAR